MDIQILAQKFYDYSRYIRGYSPQTIRSYRFAIDYLCKFQKIYEIEQVTDEIIRSFFYNGRTKRNWTPSTFISYHKSLIVFFRWCVQEKYITYNPLEDIELPRLEKKIPPKLTRKEAIKLLEVVYNYPYNFPFLRYRNHAMFATFIYAGLRRGELLNLKLTDIDLENYTIYIRQGKGHKDRLVPICYTLAGSLKKYLTERERLKKTCSEFFVSLNRNAGFTEHGLKHLVDKLNKEMDIKFGIHKLRHTFATLMLEGGCDIYSLSRMLGHNDIKTTTIYLSASAEHLRSQITKHPLNDF